MQRRVKYYNSPKMCGEKSLLKDLPVVVWWQMLFCYDRHRCNISPRPSFLPIFCAKQRGERRWRKFSSVSRIFFAFS